MWKLLQNFFQESLLRVRQITCLHEEAELKFSSDKIHLYCPDCKQYSPGWTICGPNEAKIEKAKFVKRSRVRTDWKPPVLYV